MIKQQDTSPVEVNLDRFTNFNKQIFHDEDIIPDTYTPLTTPSAHHISTDELTNILRHKYNADKSRGLSKLPLQLLKFLEETGISSLASFLNASVLGL